MKVIVFLFLIALSFGAHSQTVAVANTWFNKYEYGLAATSFERIPDRSVLTYGDLQRWCYSYFITKNYKKSFQMADSLVKLKKTPTYFEYVRAYSAMAIQKYKIAEHSFRKYKAEDTAMFVDSLLASCIEIPTWNPEKFVQLKENASNQSGADISGMQFNKRMIMFHETGINSDWKKVADTLFQNTELVFMYPNLYEPKSNSNQRLNVPTAYKDFNITSFAFDSSNGTVFLTMNHVIDKNKNFWAPHIYKGKLKIDSIVDIALWKYAGLEDSSSTAQATINSAANLMVFTKDGKNTKGSDLYYSKKINGEWSKPMPFTQLNSRQDEMYPLFMGDSLLSFASNGRVGYGKLDIYLAQIASNKVKSIKHFHRPINSSGDDFNFTYYLSDDDAYFTSNREGGKGDDDIYFIHLKKKAPKEQPKLMKLADIIVYFDFDKSILKEEGVQKITAALQKYKSLYGKLSFTVVGNCDKRGTSKYNMALGMKRATTVRDFLISKGIEESIVSAASDGDLKSEKQCPNGCDEKKYHLDRFVKIKLSYNKELQTKN